MSITTKSFDEFDENTKFVLKHLLTASNCNPEEFVRRFKMGVDYITVHGMNQQQLESSIVKELKFDTSIKSLRAYTNSIGDNILFLHWINTGQVKRFCSSGCQHLLNDCVHPGFINELCVTDFSSIRKFFDQQLESTKHYSISFLTFKVLSKEVSLQVLEYMKPYLHNAKLNQILWSLLQNFYPLNFQDDEASDDKILFFIQFLDNYGEHINIFEKFFKAPPRPGVPGGRLLTDAESDAEFQKRYTFIQTARTNPRNYKTIVEFSNKHLVHEDDKKITVALNKRQREIFTFRKKALELFYACILPDLAKIVFHYAFCGT